MNANRTQARSWLPANSNRQPSHLPASDGYDSAHANEAFNRWLDTKLREIYRATQNEPLPQEMIDLVQSMMQSSKR